MASKASDLTLYHADWGRSCRSIWLLRELQVPFTLKVIDWYSIKDKDFMADISPLGRIPVLFDAESHLYESGAMVQYLLEKFSDGALNVPGGTQQRADFLQWFHMAETVGMRAIVKLYFYKMLPDSSPMKSEESLQDGIKKTRAFLQDLDEHLRARHKGEWIAGPDLTAADIMMSYTLGLMTYSTTGPGTPAPQVLTAEDYPTLADYWERMQQLPRYQECYKDINLLPIGDHIIKPGMSFAGQGTRSPTTFHGQGIKGKK